MLPYAGLHKKRDMTSNEQEVAMAISAGKQGMPTSTNHKIYPKRILSFHFFSNY